MAFTMACPNFKKGLKMAFGSLGGNGSGKFKSKSLTSSCNPYQNTLIRVLSS
jgi:hypothetical protein